MVFGGGGRTLRFTEVGDLFSVELLVMHVEAPQPLANVRVESRD